MSWGLAPKSMTLNMNTHPQNRESFKTYPLLVTFTCVWFVYRILRKKSNIYLPTSYLLYIRPLTHPPKYISGGPTLLQSIPC